MEIKAKARYIKMSPKKIRLVIDVIRNMEVVDALAQLKFINKLATKPVDKLLNSAVANAKHNFDTEKDNLYIKEIRVDEGPTTKRWKPRAFGRASTIRKRSSHISIILKAKKETIKKEDVKKEKLAKPEIVKEKIKESSEKESHKDDKGKAVKTQEGTSKKMFRRKAV